MRLETTFRAVLVASIVLGIVGAFVDVVFPDLIPKSINDAYEALAVEGLEAYWLPLGLLSIVYVVGIIAAIIGLLLLKRWARTTALVVTVVGLPIYVPMSPVLQSGWSAMLLEASVLLWGVMLGMAYFSPLNSRFSRQPSVVAPETEALKSGTGKT